MARDAADAGAGDREGEEGQDGALGWDRGAKAENRLLKVTGKGRGENEYATGRICERQFVILFAEPRRPFARIDLCLIEFIGKGGFWYPLARLDKRWSRMGLNLVSTSRREQQERRE